ncbi:MAG: cupin domain-containing protein [Thermoanaerobaculales bacterium]
MKRAGLLALVVVGLGFVARAVLAEDPVKVAPNVYKVILENEHVRVLSVTLKPGEKSPMHSHPANVVYTLNDSKVRFTMPDGKSVDADLKAGNCIWNEAQTHAGENIGKTTVHALVIELKEPASAPEK